MNPVRFHPKAFEELDAAASYYEKKRPGLGARFLAEARRANERIFEFPTAAREVRNSIRRRSIHQFPYSLYYLAENGEILVIAVAHKRRRPGYWEKRLKAT